MPKSALYLSVIAAFFVARASAAPPPGDLYPVFDATLHMLCVGPSAAPGVVLEAGLGGNYLDWWRVQDALSADHRVCAYDRAGAGLSSRTARPRTAEAMAAELHALVLSAHVPIPFVLVGHSFGGLLALSYARRHLDELRGLVLADSMHPDQFARFAAAGVMLERDPHMVIGRTPPQAAAYGQPAALRQQAIDLALADKARVFVFREFSAIEAISGELRAAGWPRVAARILVHGDREWDAAAPHGRMEQVWSALQTEMAAGLGAPSPVVVPGASHEIPLDAPEAVASAVRALSPRLRAAGVRRRRASRAMCGETPLRSGRFAGAGRRAPPSGRRP